MKRIQRFLAVLQRRIHRRLDEGAPREDEGCPVLRSNGVVYELAKRVRVVAASGVSLMHRIAQSTGLIREIDSRVQLLKVHRPYHESDHVLNVAYNILGGGQCLEDIEGLRNDENYLDMLDASSIPDPTTAGDFCRRFTEVGDVSALMSAINEARLRVWKEQPDSFFEEAVIDGDGTIAETTGWCKEGMDLTYKGLWGYHPLLISLANTEEPLFLVNRGGSRPSSEGAHEWFDQAVKLVRRAGFRKVTLRGDTDFSQTRHLDRWHEDGTEFIFGFPAVGKLVQMAESLEDSAWNPLERPERYEVRTQPRQRPSNVRRRIVHERELHNLHLLEECVAEFQYRPTHCMRDYRVVVLRKLVRHEKGQHELFADYRYFFYITNKRRIRARKVVQSANDRCDQERLIEQMKNGVHAMRMPVDNLMSNWAYMVMASLAWSLKAWAALLLPLAGRWREKHERERDHLLKMRFRRFVACFIRIPAQLVDQGRRLTLRVAAWNPDLSIFFRLAEALRRRRPMLC